MKLEIPSKIAISDSSPISVRVVEDSATYGVANHSEEVLWILLGTTGLATVMVPPGKTVRITRRGFRWEAEIQE